MNQKYDHADTPTLAEHDTHLSLWWEDPEDPRIPNVQRQVVKHLRDRGFRIRLDPEMLRRYSHRFAKDYHQGRKGNLWVRVERGGRCLEIKFWQEINVENPNGGRYDFGQRGRMPYQILKAYELERNHLVKVLGFPFSPCKTTNPLRGLDYIEDRRTNPKETFSPRPLGTFKPEGYNIHNAKCADGTLLQDGAAVSFISSFGPCKWRIQQGIAYHNINNMWWVLLPCGTVRNLANFEIYHRANLAAKPGRHVPQEASMSRLTAAKERAVRAEDYERAAAIRDVLKRTARVIVKVTA